MERIKKIDRKVTLPVNVLTGMLLKAKRNQQGGFGGQNSYFILIAELRDLGLTDEEIKQCF